MFDVPWSEYTPSLWKGLQLTLLYTVIGFAGAAVFGLLLALLRLSKSRILRVPAALYTEIFKNIPLLAIIFIIYFGLASIGIKLGAIEAGSLSLILFYAAYLSETFRAAIAGVHAGQQEAAEALGLGRISTFQLMSVGRLITSATFRALEVYLVIAAIYFCLCYPLSQGLLWLERKVRAGVPLTPRRRRRFKRAAVLLEQEGVLV